MAIGDAVDRKGAPPPELLTGWRCERFHCLPEVGAYPEQDEGLLTRVILALNYHNAFEMWVYGNKAEMLEHAPQAAEFALEIEKYRMDVLQARIAAGEVIE